ncbi:MAG TPA: 1-(5-phosphoribosyl)-5-amino-4-imidazole-carboxylate carboxylase, partial [Candidatus Binataceae bacterium]|nr:1-(5-phosphoribosyl)-5-amino-4-imidazole-carboxylate carboxylase [Candidatus Binataceae bacterium]
MTEQRIRAILDSVAAGRLSAAGAARELRELPFADLGFAKIDSHRSLRRGVPEVVFGESKSAQQIAAIGKRVLATGTNLIVTRISAEKAKAIKRSLPGFRFHPEARLGAVVKSKLAPRGHGEVMVISAGTSDLPIAEEAAICAELFGNRVTRLYDVGVAGLHRLTAN